MADADITPNGNWDGASSATVKEIGGSIVNNVPVIIVPWTPAKITIWKRDFPNGVVIFNENQRPANGNTESTRNYAQFNLQKVQPTPQGDIHLDITRNVGWPCGEIILWQTVPPPGG